MIGIEVYAEPCSKSEAKSLKIGYVSPPPRTEKGADTAGKQHWIFSGNKRNLLKSRDKIFDFCFPENSRHFHWDTRLLAYHKLRILKFQGLVLGKQGNVDLLCKNWNDNKKKTVTYLFSKTLYSWHTPILKIQSWSEENMKDPN